MMIESEPRVLKTELVLEPNRKRNDCARKCLCNFLFILFNIFLCSGGAAIASIAGIAKWGGDSINAVNAITSDIQYFCTNLDGANCTRVNVADLSLNISFGIGVGMFVLGIFGFILASAYNKGLPIHCLAFVYWVVFAILTLAALAMGVTATILYVNPDILLQAYLREALANASATENAQFYAKLAKFSYIFMISGWCSLAMLIVVAISGARLLAISKVATDARNNAQQPYYTNAVDVNYNSHV